MPEKIEGIFGYGQSNIGWAGDVPATFTKPLFPDRSLGFARPNALFGSAPRDPSCSGGLTTFINVPGKAMASMFAAANALPQFAVDANRQPGKYFWHFISNGGKPISVFLKGTEMYGEMLLAVRTFAANAREVGYEPVVSVIFWIQGESWEDDPALKTRALVESLIPDIMAETGQSAPPAFVIFQVNNNVAYNNPDLTALAQFEVARHTPNCLLAGPMYYTPMELFLADGREVGIHGTEIGRMMVAEVMALCLKALLVDRIPWVPLTPERISREGRFVTIEYAKPTYGEGLAWDTEWVGPTANYGFGCRDDRGSIHVVEVTLDSPNWQVRVELNQAPTGSNPMVSYAIGPGTHTVLPPWAAVRGQLISPTAQQSLFHRHGYGMPPFVAHYGARFELPI